MDDVIELSGNQAATIEEDVDDGRRCWSKNGRAKRPTWLPRRMSRCRSHSESIFLHNAGECAEVRRERGQMDGKPQKLLC